MTDRYLQHAGISVAVIAVYVVLGLIIIALGFHGGGLAANWGAVLVLIVIGIFGARYLTTTYLIDADHLTAWRIFGTRRIPLESIRRIEYGNLRDLGMVGFFGSWGWRGRVWSPLIGKFDAVYTNTAGLLITAETIPLFMSPKDPTAFARELSRRVRSYSGRLAADVGEPAAEASAAVATRAQ
jgi:Bacterial PH domain